MSRYISLATVLGVLAGLALFGSRPVTAQNAAEWGTIKGQIVWPNDKLPEPVEVKVDKDKDHCLSKGKIYSEEWTINPKNKGLRWIFVWLAPVDPKGTMPIHPKLKAINAPQVVMDQPCCKFEPHALAMREGQLLVAKNSATIPHNFAYSSKLNPGGNILIPAGQQVPIMGLKADARPMSVGCTIHGWMKAWVRIYDHPYYAVTDADGNFEIKDAPAGKFRLMVWGDNGWSGGAKGRDGQEITIKGDSVNDLGKIAWKLDE
jgi:hypothetical protein